MHILPRLMLRLAHVNGKLLASHAMSQMSMLTSIKEKGVSIRKSTVTTHAHYITCLYSSARVVVVVNTRKSERCCRYDINNPQTSVISISSVTPRAGSNNTRSLRFICFYGHAQIDITESSSCKYPCLVCQASLITWSDHGVSLFLVVLCAA